MKTVANKVVQGSGSFDEASPRKEDNMDSIIDSGRVLLFWLVPSIKGIQLLCSMLCLHISVIIVQLKGSFDSSGV